MARKKFEEVEFDPIEAEARRALARSVSQPVAPSPPAESSNVLMMPRTAETPPPARQTDEQEAAPPRLESAVPRREKKRSFSCANPEQDYELDALLLRLQDVAGTHIPFQVIGRAAIVAVLSAEQQIIIEMQRQRPPKFPAKSAHAEYALFEEYWIQIIQKALRKARPFGN
jgi:hypothetical protein